MKLFKMYLEKILEIVHLVLNETRNRVNSSRQSHSVATVSAGVETDWQRCVTSHPALASSSSNFSRQRESSVKQIMRNIFCDFVQI